MAQDWLLCRGPFVSYSILESQLTCSCALEHTCRTYL
jgi:hypothetical protein